MDLRRYLDLYLAETQEHLRALQKSLLALDGAAGTAAVDEAFRAAHTIKGLSAAMGYRAVADRAHSLEDALDGVRRGGGGVEPGLVDRLLEEADALERGVAEAVATITPQLDGGGSGTSAGAAAAAAPTDLQVAPGIRPPAGATQVLVVEFVPDAPIKSARALLIVRNLQGVAGYLGASPERLPETFEGPLHLFLSEQADVAAVRERVQRAGDVASVTLARPTALGSAGQAAQGGQSRAVAPPKGRQVRVPEARLDGLAEGIGELSVLRNRLAALEINARAAGMIDRMSGLLSELQLAVLAMRMVPLAEAFERLPRAVRDASRRTGKDVELRVEGEEIELDRAILNEIGDPLIHLVRNAVDHGIEAPAERRRAGKPERGVIRLRAERERSSVRIVLEDDGAGVNRAKVVAKAQQAGLLPATATDVSDDALLRLLSNPGFSTADQVTEISGRGVGLDAVVSRIRALGGAVDMQTRAGHGTTFTLRLPITLALAHALRVRLGDEDYAIPLTHVSEAVELEGRIEQDDARELMDLRAERLPLVRLAALLQLPTQGSERYAVIAESGERRAALAVDELVGHEQILVKSFDPAPGTLPVFSGATLLADGRPALVLDPLSVI